MGWLAAVSGTRSGCGCPGLVRGARLRTCRNFTGALCSHHSRRPLRSRVVSSLRPVAGTRERSVRTAFLGLELSQAATSERVSLGIVHLNPQAEQVTSPLAWRARPPHLAGARPPRV